MPAASSNGAASPPARSSAGARSSRASGSSATSARTPPANAPPGGSRLFVAGEASRRLSALKRLTEAIADGTLRGLARGVAYQLVEQSGILDRRRADEHIRALSAHERRVLKSLGVRFGAFSLYLPALLTEEARSIGSVFAELAAPGWRPAPTASPSCRIPPRRPRRSVCAALRAVAGLTVPVLALERLDALSRFRPAGLVELTPALMAEFGWKPGAGEPMLRVLCFVRLRRPIREASLWRRRAMAARPPAHAAATPAAVPAERPARPSPVPPAGRDGGGRDAAPPRRALRLERRDRTCRVDVWLWRARFFKTRSLAARIVEHGGVRLMRGAARTSFDKPSRPSAAVTCSRSPKGRAGSPSRSKRSECDEVRRLRRGRFTACCPLLPLREKVPRRSRDG